MKTIKLLLSFSLLVLSSSFSFGQSWLWGLSGQGGQKPLGNGSAVATDRNGNGYVTGDFANQIIFGLDTLTNGSNNAFLAKFNSAGNVLWAVNPVDSINSISEGTSVIVDNAGNIYVTGAFIGSVKFGAIPLRTPISNSAASVFLVKYSSSGNVIWAKQAVISSGDSYGAGYSITLDKSANVYITGNFTDTISFGSYKLTGTQAYNVFIARYDSSGNVLWVSQTNNNSTGNGYGYGIAVDNSGNILVSGQFFNTLSFGSYNVNSPNYVFSVFLAKYSPSGNPLWATQSVNLTLNIGTYSAGGSSVTTDNAGNSYITGYLVDTLRFGTDTMFASNYSAFLVKYDSLGNSIWCKQSSPAWIGTSIASDSINNIYMAGYNVSGTDTFQFGSYKIYTHPWSGNGSFILKLDTSGAPLCGSMLGNLNTSSTNIVSDYSGKYVYMEGGFFQDTIFCAIDTLVAVRGSAVFLGRWHPCNNEEGINELNTKTENLTVFPNPFTSTTTILFNPDSHHDQSSPANTHYLEVDDLTGRDVMHCVFTGSLYELSAQGLAKGMYFIRVRDGENNVIGNSKVIIQ